MSRTAGRILLGVLFVLAGINHFVQPRLYASIMPDYLPRHQLLVWLSGVAEVVCGMLIFIPRMHNLARWSLLALLVAIFPANLHMALNQTRYPMIPGWLLWLRLPLQGVLMAWVWWSTVLPRSKNS